MDYSIAAHYWCQKGFHKERIWCWVINLMAQTLNDYCPLLPVNVTAYHFILSMWDLLLTLTDKKPNKPRLYVLIYCKNNNTLIVSLKETELKANFCLPLLFRDNDITGVLDHTFCVEHNAYGEIIQHELKPNGKTISVSEDTKKEYVRYDEWCINPYMIFPVWWPGYVFVLMFLL